MSRVGPPVCAGGAGGWVLDTSVGRDSPVVGHEAPMGTMENVMAWPKQVPILTADDIIRATYESEDGTRCCLIGWLDRVFPNALSVPGVYAVRNRAIKSIYSVIEESAPVGTAISSFNDTRPKARVAEVWNEAMRRLGYTEVFEVAE